MLNSGGPQLSHKSTPRKREFDRCECAGGSKGHVRGRKASIRSQHPLVS